MPHQSLLTDSYVALPYKGTPPALGGARVVREGRLTVRTTENADRYLVAVCGELDFSNARLLEMEIRRAESSAARRTVVDLRGLDFMDSSGLHVLLAAQQRAAGDGGRLRLVRGPSAVQRVFELTGTESALPFLA